MAIYLGLASRRGSSLLPAPYGTLLGVAPGGVCPPAGLPGRGVVSYTAISPLPTVPSLEKMEAGGMFLLHFPYPAAADALAGRQALPVTHFL